MALPPERISVKRRRDDTPIETFYLEEHHRTKRRITTGTSNQAYQFRLIKASAILPVSQQQHFPPKTQSTPSLSGPSAESNGIPSIRSTAPGDEVTDFAKFKQEQAASVLRASTTYGEQKIHQTPAKQGLPPAEPPPPPPPPAANLRRFHLTRYLPSTHSTGAPISSSSSKARVTTSAIRPPLPTFIEKQQLYDGIYTKPPIDRIISQHSTDHEDKGASTSQTDDQAEGQPLAPFTKSKAPAVKDGVSLQDPAASWNIDSDQLANELAALAMDLDPDLRSLSATMDESTPLTRPARPPRQEDEFIYETYMRMPYDSTAYNTDLGLDGANFGVLVIEEADEDLWQEYMESDEESDWDEEDSNAEDNPANDYPDEDLSDDDEYDRNAYRYHRGDDDEYGFDEDDDAD